MEIDNARKVYLFTHGRADLRERALVALESEGISNSMVIDAVPHQTGQVGDYMAMMWMPPKPDHIKIQRITKVVPVEPQGMVGLWKGVSSDELGTISL